MQLGSSCAKIHGQIMPYDQPTLLGFLCYSIDSHHLWYKAYWSFGAKIVAYLGAAEKLPLHPGWSQETLPKIKQNTDSVQSSCFCVECTRLDVAATFFFFVKNFQTQKHKDEGKL